MNFTRQDLQKIYDFFRKQSVMDSQFPAVSSDGIDSYTLFPVLHEGKNKRASASQLILYIQDHIDSTKVNIDVEGINARTLNAAIAELYDKVVNTRWEWKGEKLDAECVEYSWSSNANNTNDYITGLKITNVDKALNYILSILFGVNKYYWSATQEDINNIFNNN